MKTIKIVSVTLSLMAAFFYAAVFVMKGKQNCRDADFLDFSIPCASGLSLFLYDVFFVLGFVCFLLACTLPFVLRGKEIELLDIAPQD